VLHLARLQEQAFTQDEVDFLVQVANQVAIAVENALAYGQIAALKDRLTQEKLYLEDEIRSELHFADIVGHSTVLRRVLQQVEIVAPTDATVLISGETGTGPVARAGLAGPLTDLTPHGTPACPTPHDTLAAAERKHILAVLEETGLVLGGPHGAAVRLGLKRSTLQFRLRKLGIARPGM
jgi:transcriptional regulator with GAF, ATPase, and Fis domain